MHVGTTRSVVLRSLRGTAVASVAAVPITLVLTPFVLSTLELRLYGVWATISTVIMLSSIVDGGVTAEITRRVATALAREDSLAEARAVHEGVTVLTVLALFLAGGGALSSPAITRTLFVTLPSAEQDIVSIILTALFAQVSLQLVLSGYFSVLKGLQRSEFSAYARTASQVASAAVTFVFLVLDYGLWALLFGTVAGSLTAWLILWRAVHRVRPHLRLRLRAMPVRTAASYMALSLVIITGNVANLIDYQFDKVVLSKLEGPATAGSYQLGSVLSIQSRALALLPIALMLAATAEMLVRAPARLAELEHLAAKGTFALAAVIPGGMVVFAHVFIPLWLGPGYQDVVLSTQLLAVALFCNCLTAPGFYAAIGRGWYSLLAAAACAHALSNAAASLYLAFHFGLVGVLVGSIIGNVVGLATLSWLLRRRGQTMQFRFLPRPTLIALTVGLAYVWALSQLGAVSWLELGILGFSWVVLMGVLLSVTGSSGLRITRQRPFVLVDMSHAS